MSLTAFSSSISDVLTVYHQAVNDFNAGYKKPKTDPAWVNLKKALDSKVMVTGINKPKANKGPNNVIDFLNAAQATFTNDLVIQTVLYGSTLAAVYGTADWADNDHDDDGQIAFHFEFCLRRDAPDWKILRLTATSPR